MLVTGSAKARVAYLADIEERFLAATLLGMTREERLCYAAPEVPPAPFSVGIHSKELRMERSPQVLILKELAFARLSFQRA